MGLDLILYKRVKPREEMSMDEKMANELAYGRKTWAIADFFTSRCEEVEPDNDYEFIVTKQDWDEFMDSVSELNDPAFRKMVEQYIEFDDNADVYEVNDWAYLTYPKLEAWLDGALSNSGFYQLGLDWELEAVLRWFDADPQVQEAFEFDIEVRLIQSY